MLLAFILRRLDPDGWLDRLPAEGRTLDRGFARALRRRVHFPDGRPEFRLRDLLPWRRPVSEVIEIVERPARIMPPADPAAVISHVVDTLLGDARDSARTEVERHINGLPRGRERAGKFSALVLAHELRTTRVVETELRRERRAAGQPVPDIDYHARLAGEMRALEAEIAAERTAETFVPLTEQELSIRQGQLALIRLLLDHDNARADLQRRRAARPAGAVGGSDDGGNLDVPQRRVSIDLGMEL